MNKITYVVGVSLIAIGLLPVPSANAKNITNPTTVTCSYKYLNDSSTHSSRQRFDMSRIPSKKLVALIRSGNKPTVEKKIDNLFFYAAMMPGLNGMTIGINNSANKTSVQTYSFKKRKVAQLTFSVNRKYLDVTCFYK